MYEPLYIGYIYMYLQCKYHNYSYYQTYTGWIRFQTILSLLMFFYYGNYDYLSLSFVNNLGCFFGVHGFYMLSKYELLKELITNNISKYGINNPSLPFCLILDFIIHGIPVIIIMILLLNSKKNIICHSYIWVHSGLLHSTYVYNLTCSWNPCILYNCKQYSMRLIYIGWFGVLLGHYMANSILNFYFITSHSHVIFDYIRMFILKQYVINYNPYNVFDLRFLHYV